MSPRPATAPPRRAAAAASVAGSAQWGCPATSPRGTPSRCRRLQSPPGPRSRPRRGARRRPGGRPWARGTPCSGPRASGPAGTWPRAPGDPFREARGTTPAPPLPRLTARSAKPPLDPRGRETEAREARTELVSGGRPRTQGPTAGRPRASSPAHRRGNSESFSSPLQPPHSARPTFPTEPSLGRLQPAPPLGGLLSSP